MNMWPQFGLGTSSGRYARRRDAPLAFMHIPKCGGTSLMRALESTVPAGPHLRGFDRFSFGGFEDFASIPSSMRRLIHLTPDSMRPDAAAILGHFSLSTIERHYPDADIITVLREPTARLLSHWVYWRSLRWRQFRHWGPAWSARLKIANRPLADFLSAPEIACQTDNIVIRMLLWPHELLPDQDFIDPAYDSEILKNARSRLHRFNFIAIFEDRQNMMADFSSWYGQPLRQLNLNQTVKPPRRHHTRLNRELDTETLRLLHQRSRLDTVLWRDVAKARAPDADIVLLQEAARLQMVAHCSRLLG